MRGAAALWLVALLLSLGAVSVAQAQVAAGFVPFLQSLWPEAQQRGISRATFDAATRDLTPDLTLPDLVLPGRAEKPPPQQAEFVQTPADYVRETTIANLASQGRKLAATHRETLARIEQKYGVPPGIILAIWGRETAFGGHKLPHDAVRVLATQAYVGRRKDLFRNEFLAALKLLQDGHVTRARMKSSWAGAMGHTQFLPSEFDRHAVDFDGDGRADIWSSIPDALASAASQLVGKGWKRGVRWAYEVRAPSGIDCTIAQPSVTATAGDWIKRGYVPAYGRKLSAEELKEDASLLMPEGTYGPAFLTTKNYFVIKEYNFSDLYVLFVGHLADRIDGGRGFEKAWSQNSQLRSQDVEDMQRRLIARGLYADKVDGRAGMLTRAALGSYQKASRIVLDCWPTAGVLEHMRGR